MVGRERQYGCERAEGGGGDGGGERAVLGGCVSTQSK